LNEIEKKQKEELNSKNEELQSKNNLIEEMKSIIDNFQNTLEEKEKTIKSNANEISILTSEIETTKVGLQNSNSQVDSFISKEKELTEKFEIEKIRLEKIAKENSIEVENLKEGISSKEKELIELKEKFVIQMQVSKDRILELDSKLNQANKELDQMEEIQKKYIRTNQKLHEELTDQYKEEKEEKKSIQWEKDENVVNCPICSKGFTTTRRRHHCRNCKRVFCGKCAGKSWTLPDIDIKNPSRVCDLCYEKLLLLSKQAQK